MGCTSAKPTRTTSIDDVAGKPHNSNQVQDKNGQVNKPSAEKALEREKKEKSGQNETNAIQIPGAHRSFMAPDGIPFIDEDVESEVDETAGNQAATPKSDNRNVKHISPDQNKNLTVVTNKEVKLASADASKSSALQGKVPDEAAAKATVRVSEVESRKEPVTSEPSVITNIKLKEVEITATKGQENDSGKAKEADRQKTREEELAATRIQAGIRGYLDRQKVKAIRANIQHSKTEEEKKAESQIETQQQSGPEVNEQHSVETHTEWQHTDEESHDPKLDEAATKIQASYKGYRTRKVIKTQYK